MITLTITSCLSFIPPVVIILLNNMLKFLSTNTLAKYWLVIQFSIFSRLENKWLNLMKIDYWGWYCFLKTLYNKYGARKVALIGLGLIGCTPHAISKTNRTACVDELNSAAQLFNQKLVSLVDQLNTNLADAKFIFVNSTGMSTGDPTSVGKCI